MSRDDLDWGVILASAGWIRDRSLHPDIHFQIRSFLYLSNFHRHFLNGFLELCEKFFDETLSKNDFRNTFIQRFSRRKNDPDFECLCDLLAALGCPYMNVEGEYYETIVKKYRLIKMRIKHVQKILGKKNIAYHVHVCLTQLYLEYSEENNDSSYSPYDVEQFEIVHTHIVRFFNNALRSAKKNPSDIASLPLSIESEALHILPGVIITRDTTANTLVSLMPEHFSPTENISPPPTMNGNKLTEEHSEMKSISEPLRSRVNTCTLERFLALPTDKRRYWQGDHVLQAFDGDFASLLESIAHDTYSENIERFETNSCRKLNRVAIDSVYKRICEIDEIDIWGGKTEIDESLLTERLNEYDAREYMLTHDH